MIDFHAHILPGMDDGSGSVDESDQMLRASAAMGVDIIVATPHFYREKESISSFIRRRARALAALEERRSGDWPEIILGAEVAFYLGLSTEEQLGSLCIGDTNFMMVEMPFEKWTKRQIKEIQNLIAGGGINPIIAHIERYFSMQDKGRVEELTRVGILTQVNHFFITDKHSRRKALKMMRQGEIHLLGSDCHNMTDRKPDYAEARDIIVQKLGDGILQDIEYRGRAVLNR